MMPYFRCGWSDLDQIWQSDAYQHVDYCDVVGIKTEEKFQYGGRLFFQKRK